MLYRLADDAVELRGGGHFVAPGAAVIGKVILEQNVSIWFNAVLRGDNEPIHIGEGSNVQECAVLHTDPGYPLRLDSMVTVGHHAMLHGCSVAAGSLIGINAVVLNGARLGQGCLIGANALVPEGMEVPDGAVVLGSPGRVRRIMDAEEQTLLRAGAASYIKKGRYFDRHLQLQSEGRIGLNTAGDGQ